MAQNTGTMFLHQKNGVSYVGCILSSRVQRLFLHWPIADNQAKKNRIEGKLRRAAIVQSRNSLVVPSKKYGLAIQSLDGQQRVLVPRPNLEVLCWTGATPDKF
jgi:hypothetical protein